MGWIIGILLFLIVATAIQWFIITICWMTDVGDQEYGPIVYYKSKKIILMSYIPFYWLVRTSFFRKVRELPWK